MLKGSFNARMGQLWCFVGLLIILSYLNGAVLYDFTKFLCYN